MRDEDEEAEEVDDIENTAFEADEPGEDEPDEDKEEIDLDNARASAAGKASAARLLHLLVENKALALHVKKPGAKLIERVARILESPLPPKARATKLSDVIVDSEDVDDFFLDDDTLVELLKRW
jgi:hypothetical protein